MQAAELPHSSASVNEMLASIDFDNNNEMDEREWRSFICAQVCGVWCVDAWACKQARQVAGGVV